MKYFNIKRYKFSTITRNLNKLTYFTSNLYKGINFKKIYNYLNNIKHTLRKTPKYFNPLQYDFFDIIRKIKIRSNRFLFFHLPAFIVFFGLLYLAIPKFYAYDKLFVKKNICKSKNIECVIKGKITYDFFPTPRLKLKDLMINLSSNNKKIFTAKDVSLILSFKNLLAKEKHKIKNIVISEYEGNINLKKLNDFNFIFKEKVKVTPILFKNGKIVFYDQKNYVATISDANLVANFLENLSKLKLEGKFLDNNIIFNFSNKIIDDKPETNIEIKMKEKNFLIKLNFFDSHKNIKNGKFFVRKDKNKISGIFDYKDNKITIIKSNTNNTFIDGKLTGKIILLPYFDFDLDLNLNSINFTRLYNYFLSLDNKEQKELFKINNKINGKLNFSTERIYSKHNLVKSFESRMKFYNGNIKIEQFLINLGKLGAADLLGTIDNDKGSTNFKFESNIFVDNKKKFLSKFGIYNKEKISSNLFIRGNFDLDNTRASFYEIFSEEKFNTEDVNFIESEFNELMFENDFENLFNFKKFKVFLKSARDEEN